MLASLKAFDISGREIGAGNPCYVIAEAGVNHNGDRELAHRLVDAAADACADAVKFQTWITEEICARNAVKAEYQKRENREDGQFEMLKRLELPFAWHAELKLHAEERGIAFLSTPDDIESARFLCELGVSAIKVGSAELTNLPYLAQLAALGRPLILSTGMSDVIQISRSLEEIRSVRNTSQIALLHCVSAYPAPEEEMNLRCIAALRDRFGVPAGLSDHTIGSLAATLGVGLGISIYEKHITLDRRLPGPDQSASTEPDEFAAIVNTIRKAERMMGSGVKAATPSESSTAIAVQRVLVYIQDLPRDHVITSGDMKALRRGEDGLGPSELPRVIGRILQSDVRAWSAVQDRDFV
jgi:N-acetylneuraminate synthase/N,N'-diacetyllegionaminate synthase